MQFRHLDKLTDALNTATPKIYETACHPAPVQAMLVRLKVCRCMMRLLVWSTIKTSGPQWPWKICNQRSGCFLKTSCLIVNYALDI